MLEQVIISIQIILIDIVMAADNAIIIGLIAAGFATEKEEKSLHGELRLHFYLESCLPLEQITCLNLHG